MKKVVMYWSNICVLHIFERDHIETIRQELLSLGIDLQTEYFGLGYPTRMSEAMLDPAKPLPDIIISTDLEVFENRELYESYSRDLYEIGTWFPTKKKENYRSLYGDPHLLPFIAIPMMLYSRDSSWHDTSLEDLVNSRIAFGGINNSAAKCIFKYLWAQFGKKTASDFLERCDLYDMPIQGMHAVKTGSAEASLVPSIYALRADMIHEFAYPLSDGCIVLPSFAAVRNSIDEETARTILFRLLSPSFCNFFVSNGDLISCIEGTSECHSGAIADAQYLYPNEDWFRRVRPAEFYESYCRILPTAVDYSKAPRNHPRAEE